MFKSISISSDREGFFNRWSICYIVDDQYKGPQKISVKFHYFDLLVKVEALTKFYPKRDWVSCISTLLYDTYDDLSDSDSDKDHWVDEVLDGIEQELPHLSFRERYGASVRDTVEKLFLLS